MSTESPDDLLTRYEGIRDTLRNTARSLGQMPIKSQLEADILERLIDGKRTITELVSIIYGTQRDGEEFFAHYMKTKRAARSLAARGIVATNLFGRDRPYRLTPHGIERLAEIGGRTGTKARLVPIVDRGVYAVTLVSALATFVIARLGSPDHRTMLVASSIVFFLGGIAFTRALQSIRRVT